MSWQPLRLEHGALVASRGENLPFENASEVVVDGEELVDDAAASAVVGAYAGLRGKQAPPLSIWQLRDDTRRARATALLRALPQLRALTLSCSYDDAGLPDLGAVPPSVVDLTISVLRGAQLQLRALSPSPLRTRLALSARNGSIDLRPLAEDAALAVVQLHGKLRAPEVVTTWSSLEGLKVESNTPIEQWLPARPGLVFLQIVSTDVMDFSVLGRVPRLQTLKLAGLKNDGIDLTALEALPDLSELRLGALKGLRSLASLSHGAPQLSRLSLGNLPGLASLAGVEALPALWAVSLNGDFAGSLDVSALERCPKLYEIDITGIKRPSIAQALITLALKRRLALRTEDGLM